MRRRIKYLVLHCSATPESDPRFHAKKVMQIHRDRGWKHYGYHRIIEYDGRIVKAQELDTDGWINPWEVANGVRGINKESVHICYVGGYDKRFKPKDTRTDAQRIAMLNICKWALRAWPGIKVIGHNEVAAKACPSFDVQEWLREVGLVKD